MNELAYYVSKCQHQEEMLRVLFNRCVALTGGQMCAFCGMKKECDEIRSAGKGDRP